MSAPYFKDHEAHLRAILDAALRAADLRACTREACTVSPPPSGRFAVLAVGKAAGPMVFGLRAAFPDDLGTLAIVPEGAPAPPYALVGDHPLPTERNVLHAERAKRFVESLASGGTHDGLVVLLSGGASALLALPMPGIDLREYRLLTEAMLRDGRLTIREINCVRKHCEQLKGGLFARLLGNLWCHAYLLSDVIGDPLDVIGSGPFAPDPTTFDDASRTLMDLPYALKSWFTVSRYVGGGSAHEYADTPKPGDPVFERVQHIVVANNETAIRGAVADSARLGYAAPPPGLLVQGHAADIGRRFASSAKELPEPSRPACLILGGETTVNVKAASGRGGRNQELALGAAMEIDGVPNIAIATLATDGVDGPTDAAGAIVTGETCARARGTGLEPGDFLARHDSYTFFEKVGGHIKTGPTGTNVNDIAIALVY